LGAHVTLRLGGLLICATVLTAASCGSSPAAPTVKVIAVQSSSGQLFLGVVEAFSAQETLSDGTTRAVTTGTWSSDAPAVASVDSTGRVTGKASGTATIIVDADGVRGTKLIRVLPNFGGSWSGGIFYGSCSSSGWSPGCSTIDDTLGHVVTMVFTQTGDSVTGTIVTPFITSSMSGTVAADGTLSFTSIGTSNTKTYTETWKLTIVTAGTITGPFHFDGKDSASTLSTFTIDGSVSNVVH